MSDTIQLLSYPQRTVLIEASGYSRTTNMPFNTTRKTIYKGVDNVLGFEVKNQDRKPVKLQGKDVMVNIMQVRSGQLLIQRRAEITRPEDGVCELTLFAYDLMDLSPGIYQLSAVVYNDGLASALYVDNNRAAAMEVELLDGAYPTFNASTEVSFTEISSPSGNFFASRPLQGNIIKNDRGIVHTIQMATTGFKGTVSAMGTLDYSSNSVNYVPIKFENDNYQIIFDGTQQSWIQGWNFKGSYRWVIIQYTPAADNTGTVDKVLYRS
jgi:hypothetical protein